MNVCSTAKKHKQTECECVIYLHSIRFYSGSDCKFSVLRVKTTIQSINESTTPANMPPLGPVWAHCGQTHTVHSA